VVDERAPIPTTPGHSGGASAPVDHSRDVLTLANVVTVLRLLLIPFFYWALVYGGGTRVSDTFAFFAFTLAAGTDWLDGMIARRTGTVTAIGKVIDPLVDRLLIASALVGLYVTHRAPLALLLVLVGRDVYLLYGAWVLERHGRRLPVTILGKVTTAVLMVSFASMIWRWPLLAFPRAVFDVLGHAVRAGGTHPLGSYLVWIGLALSLTAAVQYTVKARRVYAEAVATEAVAERSAAAEPAAGESPLTAGRTGVTQKEDR
jgi:cardiolipin synthase